MLNIPFIDNNHLLIFCTPDFARKFLFPSLSNSDAEPSLQSNH